MKGLFSFNNMLFLWDGLKLTLYISLVSTLFSMVIGIVLGIMRNRGHIAGKIAAVYIEVVRNVPLLLWIYVVFVVFKMKSLDAGIAAFTIFTSASVGEIVRGGLNSVDHGQWEAAHSQGFGTFKAFRHIILPQALRSMLPAFASQFVSTIKDTSYLWSVVALQELTGKSMILMGRYYSVSQVFTLFGLLALVYFIINFAISAGIRLLQKRWAY